MKSHFPWKTLVRD